MRFQWQISSPQRDAVEWHKSSPIIIRSRVSAAIRGSCRSRYALFLLSSLSSSPFFYYSLFPYPFLPRVLPPPRVATNARSQRALTSIVRASCIRQEALPISRIIGIGAYAMNFMGITCVCATAVAHAQKEKKERKQRYLRGVDGYARKIAEEKICSARSRIQR